MRNKYNILYLLYICCLRMNNTLPFSAIKKTLKEIDNYKTEIRILKETNARQTKVFISVANKLEEDLFTIKKQEMIDFQQDFDWLINNVLEQEKLKEKKWQEKEILYNKEYVKLYNRMHTEALILRDKIQNLERQLAVMRQEMTMERK